MQVTVRSPVLYCNLIHFYIYMQLQLQRSSATITPSDELSVSCNAMSISFLSPRLLLWLAAFLLSVYTEITLLLNSSRRRHPMLLLPLSSLVALLLVLPRTLPSRRVYLLDFSCLRPPARLRVPIAALLEHLHLLPCFDPESVAFMSKIVTSSGLGDETYFPPSLRSLPPSTHLHDCLEEAHLLLFPVLDDLFAKTRVDPSRIDLLVLNCSGFCPAPSLSAIVVHRYAMREDVRTFNLSGMGCSAGVIAVDLASGVLASRPDCYALLLTTEILSTGWYAGRDRRKLLLNCVFRMGSAAALLTNRADARGRAKYRLAQVLRTQRAYDDASYRAASREEDAQGITGFSIERDLLRVVRETLRANISAVGAAVLPVQEKLRYVLFHLRRAVAAGGKAAYVPDFSSAIQHYCLPASGLAVIREIGRGLGLREKDVEPAVATFQRFGNQSASSLWYQLAYMEARGRVGVGEKVWQLGMGSGPKSNTAVWECVRAIYGVEEAAKGPWKGCLDRYPLGIRDDEGGKE